jgi:hypothetical protein
MQKKKDTLQQTKIKAHEEGNHCHLLMRHVCAASITQTLVAWSL